VISDSVSFTTRAKILLYTYVDNEDGVTSVAFTLREIRIFSEFIVILWGQRSSRIGCNDDDDDDNDNDPDYVW
jgi:hypothetical protein